VAGPPVRATKREAMAGILRDLFTANPAMGARKAARTTGCSEVTASRVRSALVAEGKIQPHTGTRTRPAGPVLRGEGMSLRAIAAETGVHHSTVAADLSGVGSDPTPDPPPTSVTGLDGKTCPAPGAEAPTHAHPQQAPQQPIPPR
jgi:hypothetical protein